MGTAETILILWLAQLLLIYVVWKIFFSTKPKRYSLTEEYRSSVTKDLKRFILYVDNIQYSFLIKNTGLDTSRENLMTYYLLENGKIVNQYKHPILQKTYSRFLNFKSPEGREKFIKDVFGV